MAARNTLTTKQWVIVIFIALVVIGALMGNKSGGSAGDSGNTITASDTCHDAVSNQLKSPGSASWQNSTNEDITGDATSGYTVSGHVDSDNSFGASLRSYFTCSVTVSGDNYHAEVTSFVGGQG